MSRLSIRLQTILPADELAALAAEAIAQCPDVLKQAEQRMAWHAPVPMWIVTNILLSADLVAALMAGLQLEDCAAASVCTAWRDGWNATRVHRRRLVRSFAEEHFQFGCDVGGLAVTPSGELLCVSTDDAVRVMDRSFHQLHIIEGILEEFHYEGELPGLMASEHGLYSWVGQDIRLWDSSTLGTDGMTFLLESHNRVLLGLDGSLYYNSLKAGPGDTVYATVVGEAYNGDDHIAILDAQTLLIRAVFGHGLIKNTYGLELGGEEVFVLDWAHSDGDTHNKTGEIHVFSLAGLHQRSLLPPNLLNPSEMLFLDGRLYVADQSPHSPCGVMTMTPQGQILHTLKLPACDALQGRYLFSGMCHFDKRLLLGLCSNSPDHDHQLSPTSVLVLRGL